jgi:two-component system sensor histidine kinase FlrB
VNSVTKPSESSFDAPDVLALTRSLELFRQVSGQLGESEELLQVRVAELKGQLAEAGELRRQELEE